MMLKTKYWIVSIIGLFMISTGLNVIGSLAFKLNWLWMIFSSLTYFGIIFFVIFYIEMRLTDH